MNLGVRLIRGMKTHYIVTGGGNLGVYNRLFVKNGKFYTPLYLLGDEFELYPLKPTHSSLRLKSNKNFDGLFSVFSSGRMVNYKPSRPFSTPFSDVVFEGDAPTDKVLAVANLLTLGADFTFIEDVLDLVIPNRAVELYDALIPKRIILKTHNEVVSSWVKEKRRVLARYWVEGNELKMKYQVL